MKLTKELKQEIDREILASAASAYLCNVGCDDFPENFMDLLRNGETIADDKEIYICQEFENTEPETLANIIEEQMVQTRKLVLHILEILYPNDNCTLQYLALQRKEYAKLDKNQSNKTEKQ